MRLIPSAVIATSLSLLLCSTAAAKDYCVAKPRCTAPVTSAAQLQAALTEAQSNGTADRFFLGDAVFAAGPYVYNSAEPVEIRGVSGTTLQSSVDDRTVLAVYGQAATVADLKLELVRPASTALQLTGASATNITVVQTLGNSAGVGVVINDGASLASSSIAMHEGTTPAVGTLSGSGTVVDSVLTSTAGSGAAVGPGAQLTVRRDTIAASLGVQAFGGRAIVRDTLIDGRAGNPNGMTAGLAAMAQSRDASEIDAARVTIVGSGEDAPTAIGAYAVGTAGSTATLRIADSAITGAGIPLVRFAESGGSATVVADRVAHRDRVPGEPFEDGPGTTTETNRLPAPSGFADAAGGDFRLLPGSPLVDAGDPAFVPDAASGSTTDLLGAPRVADGDRDCTARVDVGAYELQPQVAADGTTCTADPGAPPTPTPPTPVPPTRPTRPTRPGRRAADRTAPKLTALRAPARIAPGRALPKLGAGRRAPAIAFRLSERATVRLRFARRGRDGRFHAVKTGVSVRAAKGANRLAFSGRLTRRARLGAGSYRVTLVATDAAGNRSRAAIASFRVAAAR